MLTITEISGPLVKAQIIDSNDKPLLLEIVNVGKNKVLGEIIGINGDICDIQVYEDTSGIEIGEGVVLRGELLSVELGPGLMGTIFDGIQRPLEAIDKFSPIYIQPGIEVPSLDRDKKWNFEAVIKNGEWASFGSKIGFVQETELIKHWILIPENVSGEVIEINSGQFSIEDVVCKIKDKEGQTIEVKMFQKWPVKKPRTIARKKQVEKVFNTGQRVIDGMFPILLGAPVSTPGPFGAGKTFTQQQIAKWSDAQIVVYVGCGERGNEMAEMVKLFPELEDPRTKRPLMERTVLIANTSNMPIAAREASIYTGITIAEYFRDMGYDVVLMADSTSRWAEAMREISARLGQMPSEEGYPAYLSSRIAAFYERSGVVQTLGGDTGSVTVIGTVSPAGGDFAEPITQASLKNTQVFLALDAGLAAKRHYPSINWKLSYSLYEDRYQAIQANKIGGDRYNNNRKVASTLLSNEESLLDIVKLVGLDGLSNNDRLTLEIAKSIREDFLQQNGFDEIDTYCAFDKTVAMLEVIVSTYENVLEALEKEEYDENFVANIFDNKLRGILAGLKYQLTPEAVLDQGAIIESMILAKEG
jgi:V/A-type H+-transporting ATPase subunit A